jgi:hypothetical protein
MLFSDSNCGVYKKQKRILLVPEILHLFAHSLFNDCNKSELTNNIFERIKGKAVPLQAWTGPEVPGV